MSETVEWAIAMLVAQLELYCAIVSGYYLSFKLSGKVVKDLAIIHLHLHLLKVPRNIPKGRNAGGRQELII